MERRILVAAKGSDAFVAHGHFWIKGPAIAYNDPVSTNTVMTANGGPHRIRGSNAPAFVTTEALLLFVRERLRHRGIGKDMHQPVFIKAKTFRMTIHGHNHIFGFDFGLGCFNKPAISLLRE